MIEIRESLSITISELDIKKKELLIIKDQRVQALGIGLDYSGELCSYICRHIGM